MSLTCIEFSPDGRLIASGTLESGSLKIWNWRDGSRKSFRDLESNVRDIRFSPDGKFIAVGVDGADVECTDRPIGEKVDGTL